MWKNHRKSVRARGCERNSAKVQITVFSPCSCALVSTLARDSPEPPLLSSWNTTFYFIIFDTFSRHPPVLSFSVFIRGRVNRTVIIARMVFVRHGRKPHRGKNHRPDPAAVTRRYSRGMQIFARRTRRAYSARFCRRISRIFETSRISACRVFFRSENGTGSILLRARFPHPLAQRIRLGTVQKFASSFQTRRTPLTPPPKFLNFSSAWRSCLIAGNCQN